ncbi:Mitochondrial beta-keto-acyl synthase [Lobaria immixta]|nr:Mitochondrial beta-keto-acyl synthase [Lobaria immixta]
MSAVDTSIIAKLLPKEEKLSGKLKIKKTLAKPAKPKDTESSGKPDGKLGGNSPSPSLDSPPVNEIDPEPRASFPIRPPMEDTPEPMTCKHCKKPMEKSVWDSHVKLCLQKKQDKARRKKEAKEAKAKDAKEKSEDKDKDGDTQMDDPTSAARIGGDLPDEPGAPTEVITKSAKKSAAKATTDAPKKSKKRKADNEGGEKEPPKKKKAKKDEPPKPKVPKPKGPVDVEKQCGVQLPNGGNCARSLTCKSHSMGAKRSVPGRSLPYDLLLAQYQKKNQAKQQKAAMDANAPLPEDLDNIGPVDSDEEKDTVMAAISRSRPQPLEQHIFVPTRRKYQLVRMKEMLGNALGGRGLFGGAVGGPAAGGSASGAPFAGSTGSVGVTFTATTAGNAGSSAEAGSAVSTTGPWSEGVTEGARRASAASQSAATNSVLPQRVVTAAVGPGSRKVSAAAAAVSGAA